MRKNLEQLENPGVRAAIDKFKTTVALAKACDVAQCTVVSWLYRSVTPERAIQLEQVAGIPREKIRPDVFGPQSYKHEN